MIIIFYLFLQNKHKLLVKIIKKKIENLIEGFMSYLQLLIISFKGILNTQLLSFYKIIQNSNLG